MSEWVTQQELNRHDELERLRDTRLEAYVPRILK